MSENRTCDIVNADGWARGLHVQAAWGFAGDGRGAAICPSCMAVPSACAWRRGVIRGGWSWCAGI